MDALGLIKMDRLSVSIDAVLVDSRLAQKFVLTGEMALRASMMPGRRNFVMAVGGFNPRFAPPENFPSLKRITIELASGNNPRLTCEAVLRDHVEHDPVRCAGAAVRGGVRVQHRRRRRLRRADAPASRST